MAYTTGARFDPRHTDAVPALFLQHMMEDHVFELQWEGDKCWCRGLRTQYCGLCSCPDVRAHHCGQCGCDVVRAHYCRRACFVSRCNADVLNGDKEGGWRENMKREDEERG